MPRLYAGVIALACLFLGINVANANNRIPIGKRCCYGASGCTVVGPSQPCAGGKVYSASTEFSSQRRARTSKTARSFRRVVNHRHHRIAGRRGGVVPAVAVVQADDRYPLQEAAGKPLARRMVRSVRRIPAASSRMARHSGPVKEAERQGGAGVVSVGRPAGCPSAWCGCYLAQLLGLNDRSLWLARNWAFKFPRVAGPAPGVVAVWRHHVGQVTAVPGPGRIILKSGNDGHAVRERERSTAGVIAWVRVGT